MRRRTIATAGLVAALVVGVVSDAFGATSPWDDPFTPQPPGNNGLVTNEYAYWNLDDPYARFSNDWQNDSGSLFSRVTSEGPVFWSGVPDAAVPNRDSSNGTGSSVFRLTSGRADFADTQVRFQLNVLNQTSTTSTPRVDWDGVHVFLRYRSEAQLYYASIARRDGQIVVKKKCPGGTDNGGTYYELGSVGRQAIAKGSWHWYSTSAKSNSNGSVTFRVYRDDKLVLTATDTGVGCDTITARGRTGVRGDNTEFYLRHFTANPLSN